MELRSGIECVPKRTDSVLSMFTDRIKVLQFAHHAVRVRARRPWPPRSTSLLHR
ncbi:MAG: hypothetical protein ACK56F_08010 [bacterium]